MIKRNKRTWIKVALIPFTLMTLLLGGCASNEELVQIRQDVSLLYNEFTQYKKETDSKLDALTKEKDAMSKQLLNISASMDTREDKIKTILGKIDELEHQLQIYWNETKTEISLLKGKPTKRGETQDIIKGVEIVEKEDVPADKAKYEAAYKEAFELFQKGHYEDAINRFSAFIASYPETSLVPNAYYWIGEAWMHLKEYEKAILNFQEVIEKYPKAEKVPRALVSQAEAFAQLKDEKSSTTILKKVIELFPKSEEAMIAERRLRELTSR